MLFFSMMAYPFQLVDCYLIILVDQISRLFSITQTPDSIITPLLVENTH